MKRTRFPRIYRPGNLKVSRSESENIPVRDPVRPLHCDAEVRRATRKPTNVRPDRVRNHISRTPLMVVVPSVDIELLFVAVRAIPGPSTHFLSDVLDRIVLSLHNIPGWVAIRGL